MRETLAIALLMLNSAAGAADQTSSVQALLQQGYEIKSTTFVPLPDVKANWAEASSIAFSADPSTKARSTMSGRCRCCPS